MRNIDILDYLIDIGYSDNYICMCFLFGHESDKEWFLNLISTDKKYEYLGKEINPDMVDTFLKSMNDDTVDLKKYFQMKHVLNRADCHKAKKHRIELYAKIMEVDLATAYHLYLEYPKEAEKDMNDTFLKKMYGEDYKERYPVRKKSRVNAYYFDKNTGTLKNLRYSKYNKMYYMYPEGWRYK